MRQLVSKTLARRISHFWPLLLCIPAAYLVLGGFVVPAPSTEGLKSSSEVAVQLQTQQRDDVSVVDESRPWVYSFENERNGPIDSHFWNIETGRAVPTYNDEQQAYTARQDNVRIEDGHLIIQAKKERYESRDYTSARIYTKDRFAFTHGSLEVTMKLPRGVGSWPAAWLMPSSERYDASLSPAVTDPTRVWAVNGEIDFMEAVGYLPGQIIPATHSYNSLANPSLYTPGFVQDPYDSFHAYGIIKTPGKITFTIDGRPYAMREKKSESPLDWPFEQPYYLILNLAIGGTWAGAYGIDDSQAPWTMTVKDIRYTPLH